jgi:hypothetical protein
MRVVSAAMLFVSVVIRVCCSVIDAMISGGIGGNQHSHSSGIYGSGSHGSHGSSGIFPLESSHPGHGPQYPGTPIIAAMGTPFIDLTFSKSVVTFWLFIFVALMVLI